MIYVTPEMSYKAADGSVPRQTCIKILNEKGDELSISADNSCGHMKNLDRVSAMVFYKDGRQGEEICAITPSELLAMLTELLK